MAEYIPTIGLEIHAELNTKTKMFCDSLNDSDEKTPNTNVCPVCMGHPGTLPVANESAIRKLVQVGLALGCTITGETFFERKNYFYPDLPKGYQISQYQQPFCRNGFLMVNGRRIDIERIHLEEDAGRLYHPEGKEHTLVDYNRAGVPLMELVTQPDLRDGLEVRGFAQELQLILRYLDASHADMEKGQMRVEVNVSVRPEGQKEYGTKVEVKNLNSISGAARAVDFEIARQSAALNAGERIVQETRGWNDADGTTFSQRIKEGSADYRYFPEPDLPPVHLTDDDIARARAELPELPQQRRERFAAEYGLPKGDIEILTVFKGLGDYFEEVASELRGEEHATVGSPVGERDMPKLLKLAANYLITQLQPKLFAAQADPHDTKITPALFADLVVRIGDGQISSSAAQAVLTAMWETGDPAERIIREKDLGQVSDAAALNTIIEDAIAQNEKIVADFKAGKEAALKALIGRVMALSKGKANPQIAEQLLREKLQ